MRVEITIAGVGGQGSILAGVILGEAAVSHGGLYAVQTSAYSSELRGGFAAAWVVLEDEPVLYPRVSAPDILVAQAQDSIQRFAGTLKPGGVLIYDRDHIPAPPESIARAHGVAAGSLARRELGTPLAANLVMLGALCRVTGVVEAEALRQAVQKLAPPRHVETNLRALALGMERVE